MRIITNPQFETPAEGLEVFYQEFKASRFEELGTLKTALASSDFDSLLKMAHKWKGFCEPYGFGELAILSDELAQQARNKEVNSCKKTLVLIEEYLNSK